MTTASSISSLRLSDVRDREANEHSGDYGANAAMLYPHAVPADAQTRRSGPGLDRLFRTGRA
jgi:hypothetical protein